MTKKSKEQEIQQSALELQIIEQQIKQMEEQFNQIEMKKVEMDQLGLSLQDFKKSKNSDSFSDIGLGIYGKTKIIDDSNLLVNVGAGVYTTKKVEDVGEILKKQSKELEKIAKEIVQNIQTLSMQAQVIQMNLEKISN